MMVVDEISWIKVHTRAEVEAMSEGAKVDLIVALESRLCALEPRVRELQARTRWLHVVATPELTLYHVDDKRGQQAMEAHGVLPQFTGRLVHDCWAPYFAYEGCAHGLCGAHLLRELTFAHEQQGQTWALEMSLGLLYLAGLRAARSDAPFSAEALAFFEAQYGAILAGARRFARLRSYVSTLIKQHRHVLTHIAHAITGTPWIPHPSEAAG